MRNLIWLLAIPALAQENYFLGERMSIFQIMGGWNEPNSDNEIYDFSNELLTFDDSDLAGPSFQFNYFYQVNNFVAVGGGIYLAEETTRSEDRDFVFENGDPIVQETGLETGWFGALVNITPFGAGEFFGSKAWLPNTFVPYIQLGAGIKSYDFYQTGDFVDFETLDIFYDDFSDTGNAGSFRLGVGLRINLSKHMDLDLLGQKDWAETELNGDFEGFGDIDFGSTAYQIGLTLRI